MSLSQSQRSKKRADTVRARQWYEDEMLRRNNILLQREQLMAPSPPPQPVRAQPSSRSGDHHHHHRHNQQQPQPQPPQRAAAAEIRRNGHARPLAAPPALVVAERERADRANARAYYDSLVSRQHERQQQQQQQQQHLHHDDSPSFVQAPPLQAPHDSIFNTSPSNEASLWEVAVFVLSQVVGTAFTVVAMLLCFLFELALEAWRRSWRKCNK